MIDTMRGAEKLETVKTQNYARTCILSIHGQTLEEGRNPSAYLGWLRPSLRLTKSATVISVLRVSGHFNQARACEHAHKP